MNAIIRKEMIVIDTAVANYQTLLAGLAPDIEVVLMSGGDGLQQMADALAGKTGLDAIYVISHGSAGRIQLGDSLLDAAGLAQHSPQLATIGAALAEHGDLLLYGCEVGAGDTGRALVEELALLTGADVAASDNITGSAARGGDWQLELRQGTIEAATPFSALALHNFSGVLALPADNTTYQPETFKTQFTYSEDGNFYINSSYSLIGTGSAIYVNLQASYDHEFSYWQDTSAYIMVEAHGDLASFELSGLSVAEKHDLLDWESMSVVGHLAGGGTVSGTIGDVPGNPIHTVNLTNFNGKQITRFEISFTGASYEESATSPSSFLFDSFTIKNATAKPAITYSATTFAEADANDGSLTDSITLTLDGDTFTGTNGQPLTGANVTNVPAGLTAVVTKTSDTVATVTLTGKATAHASTNDVTNLTIMLGNGAFTGGNATKVTNATKSDLVIDFADPAPSATFTFDTNTSVGAHPDTVVTDTQAGVTLTVSPSYWASNAELGAWITGDIITDGATTYSFSQAVNISNIDWINGTANAAVTFVDLTPGSTKTQTFTLTADARQTLTLTGWEGVTAFKITGGTFDTIDNIVFTVAASTPTPVLGGVEAEGNLKVTVLADGTMVIDRFDGTDWNTQFYDNDEDQTDGIYSSGISSGNVIEINGNAIALGAYAYQTVNTAGQPSAQVSKSGNTITTVWTIDNTITEGGNPVITSGTVVVTQRITLAADTSQAVNIEWDITNNTGAELTDVRLARVVDSFLAGGDTGAGVWIPSQNTVGVQKLTSDGIQQMLLKSTGALAPADVESREYQAVLDAAASNGTGGLRTDDPATEGVIDGIDTDPTTDNGYAMEWVIPTLANAATATIAATESFVASNVLTEWTNMDAPTGAVGSPIELDFEVSNVSGVEKTSVYSVEVPAGWTAAQLSVSSSTLEATDVITTFPDERKATVTVTVTPPAGTDAGDYEVLLKTTVGTSTTTTIGTVTVEPPDTTPPAFNDESSIPSDGATNASVNGTNGNLRVRFTEDVTLVSGKTIKLYKADGDVLVATFATGDSELFSVSGSRVDISLGSLTLDYATDYYVNIDAGAFIDGAGNEFAGITDATTWNFTTMAAPDGIWTQVGETFGADSWGGRDLEFSGTTPYVLFDSGGMLTVMMRDNGSWLPVGNEGFIGANQNTADLEIGPDGKPYVVSYSFTGDVTVMRFNAAGTGWEIVDTAIATGGVNNQQPDIEIYGNQLYVAYRTGVDSNRDLTVKTLDLNASTPTWADLGAPNFLSNGVNPAGFNLALSANGTPYVAWADSSGMKLSIAKYDTGTGAWGSPVDIDTFAGWSNADTNTVPIDLKFNGEIPYVIYNDNTGLGAVVYSTEGTGIWHTLGDRINVTFSGYHLDLEFDNAGTPYMTSSDWQGVVVMKWNSVTSAWTELDPTNASSVLRDSKVDLQFDSNNKPFLVGGNVNTGEMVYMELGPLSGPADTTAP
ncbi:MAG: DUF4347 domain-containing protein, partial [Methylobacter sp.]|nr:DUF4347 domain-containing protein [Methylobacter sp.]